MKGMPMEVYTPDATGYQVELIPAKGKNKTGMLILYLQPGDVAELNLTIGDDEEDKKALEAAGFKVNEDGCIE